MTLLNICQSIKQFFLANVVRKTVLLIIVMWTIDQFPARNSTATTYSNRSYVSGKKKVPLFFLTALNWNREGEGGSVG
jgi:hypothetical protein